MEKNSQDLEIIDEQGLAQRLKVELKVVKKAVKNGRLRPGRHYFFLDSGKPLFEWGPALIAKLHEDCLQAPPKAALSRLPAQNIPSPKEPGINRAYFAKNRC